MDQSIPTEVSSCLDDVLSAVSYTCKARGVFQRYTPCTPEVLFYEYDKITKERKVEKETADTWDGPCETELSCEICGESHGDIIQRGPSAAGWRLDSLSVFCPDISEDQLITGRRPKECYASVMCQCCLMGKENPEEVEEGFGERCSACGISNLLCCDEDIVEDHFHYNTYRPYGLCGFCPSCSEHLSEQGKSEKLYDRRDNLSIPHGQDYEDMTDSHIQTGTVGDGDSEDFDVNDS